MTDQTLLTERSARVVALAKLLRSAGRRKANQFLVEGFNAVSEAIANNVVSSLYATCEAAERYQELLAGRPITLIDNKAAAKLTDMVSTTGLFAVADLVDCELSTLLATAPTLLAVPVEMSDPGNVGTIIRLSDAMGADGVILAGDSVDPHNPKAVRASAGSIFHLPISRPGNIHETLDLLVAQGISLVATAASGEIDLTEAGAVLTQPTAWLWGNEAHGLPSDVLERANQVIRIPIYGRAESLNIATAAAITLYESRRHRPKIT